MDKKTFRNVLLTILPLVAVILTALPNGFMMRFFAGEGNYYIEYVSGFDPILMGYGNIGPMLTGVQSAILTLRGILCLFGKPASKGTGMAWTAFLLSLLNNLLGSITVASCGISAVLLLNLAVCIYTQNRNF